VLPIHKILAPTDLSELSLAGLRYAFDIAADIGSEVIVFHVVGYHEAMPIFEGIESGYVMSQVPLFEDLVKLHEKQLDEFLEKHHLGEASKAKLRKEVVIGTPYEKIVQKAGEERVDAIVISTHGRTGLGHALIGSVAEKVVRLAKCPVLTVRPPIEKLDRQAAA
jgi:nucleotide-binding universal stress UspA family protein